MSDFIRSALEAQLNANLAEVRAAGFDVAVESDSERVVSLQLVPRPSLPALPGPGAESVTESAETERETTGPKSRATVRSGGSAAASTTNCRYCGKKLRGDNTVGVCSGYTCRKKMKGPNEKH